MLRKERRDVIKRELETAAKSREEAKADFDQASRNMRIWVRQGVEEKMPIAAVARAAGLSRWSVYNILGKIEDKKKGSK